MNKYYLIFSIVIFSFLSGTIYSQNVKYLDILTLFSSSDDQLSYDPDNVTDFPDEIMEAFSLRSNSSSSVDLSKTTLSAAYKIISKLNQHSYTNDLAVILVVGKIDTTDNIFTFGKSDSRVKLSFLYLANFLNLMTPKNALIYLIGIDEETYINEIWEKVDSADTGGRYLIALNPSRNIDISDVIELLNDSFAEVKEQIEDQSDLTYLYLKDFINSQVKFLKRGSVNINTYKIKSAQNIIISYIGG